MLRIGIETRPLTGAMTGIGNYCFHLLSALTRDYSELNYVGFGLKSWTPIDSDALRAIGEAHQKTGTNAGGNARSKRAIRSLGESTLKRLSRSDFVFEMYKSRFTRTIRRQALDLFHAFNFIPLADPGVVALPVVYDLSFVRFPEFHPKERLKRLERLPALLREAPRVQTISRFSQAEIADVYGYPNERIFVAPPAASSLFRPLGVETTQRDLRRLDLSVGKYLLAVGTLEPRKNLQTLVTAFGRLPKAERDHAPLVIAGGKGWGELDLPAEATKLLSEGSLRFPGAVSDAELRSLYEGAIALMFPSIYEGFGMPVVEAMACGTQVVHSKNTSMDEITEGLATGLAATDVAAWSDVMRELIAGSPRHNAAARTALVQRAASFSWTRSAALVREAYSTLT